jgi:hypothetical protein
MLKFLISKILIGNIKIIVGYIYFKQPELF